MIDGIYFILISHDVTKFAFQLAKKDDLKLFLLRDCAEKTYLLFDFRHKMLILTLSENDNSRFTVHFAVNCD